jgi:hypothetical protein
MGHDRTGWEDEVKMAQEIDWGHNEFCRAGVSCGGLCFSSGLWNCGMSIVEGGRRMAGALKGIVGSGSGSGRGSG